jgi:hypothetical protein
MKNGKKFGFALFSGLMLSSMAFAGPLADCLNQASTLHFPAKRIDNNPLQMRAIWHLPKGKYIGYGGLGRACRIEVTGSSEQTIEFSTKTQWELSDVAEGAHETETLTFVHPSPRANGIRALLFCDMNSSTKYKVSIRDVVDHLTANGFTFVCTTPHDVIRPLNTSGSPGVHRL